jgi:putative inorganic carbon (HCO3(-)) transporter
MLTLISVFSTMAVIIILGAFFTVDQFQLMVVTHNAVQTRLEIWSAALDIIQKYPLTGIGMNTFRTVFWSLYPPTYIPAGYDIGHAHNEILQTALDLGIPGMIAYLMILLITFVKLFKNWPQIKEKSDILKGLILAVTFSLAAHFVFGLFDAVALGAKPGLLFWMLIGQAAYIQTAVSSAS